jgi:hypothetical protein
MDTPVVSCCLDTLISQDNQLVPWNAGGRVSPALIVAELDLIGIGRKFFYDRSNLASHEPLMGQIFGQRNNVKELNSFHGISLKHVTTREPRKALSIAHDPQASYRCPTVSPDHRNIDEKTLTVSIL